MTPRVNALVPASDCAAKGFVTGFFYGRDLLPSLSNSNAGEIFFAMVPDPGGQYSCSHASADVMRTRAGNVRARVAAHDLVLPSRGGARR